MRRLAACVKPRIAPTLGATDSVPLAPLLRAANQPACPASDQIGYDGRPASCSPAGSRRYPTWPVPELATRLELMSHLIQRVGRLFAGWVHDLG
jgi:hypothetical protein